MIMNKLYIKIILTILIFYLYVCLVVMFPFYNSLYFIIDAHYDC